MPSHLFPVPRRLFLLLSGVFMLHSVPVESKPAADGELSIWVNVTAQELYLYGDSRLLKTYPVSTAKKGIGNITGSQKTPLGKHYIAQKIGNGAPLLTIFKGRVNTGRIARLNERDEEDFVTTRIMWLKGLEPGVNLGGETDSFNRYIYIHGTPAEDLIGSPASHGCIRMKNTDVIDLFDRVSEGTPVEIVKD